MALSRHPHLTMNRNQAIEPPNFEEVEVANLNLDDLDFDVDHPNPDNSLGGGDTNSSYDDDPTTLLTNFLSMMKNKRKCITISAITVLFGAITFVLVDISKVNSSNGVKSTNAHEFEFVSNVPNDYQGAYTAKGSKAPPVPTSLPSCSHYVDWELSNKEVTISILYTESCIEPMPQDACCYGIEMYWMIEGSIDKFNGPAYMTSGELRIQALASEQRIVSGSITMSQMNSYPYSMVLAKGFGECAGYIKYSSGILTSSE
jgi:hypothetical protein